MRSAQTPCFAWPSCRDARRAGPTLTALLLALTCSVTACRQRESWMPLAPRDALQLARTTAAESAGMRTTAARLSGVERYHHPQPLTRNGRNATNETDATTMVAASRILSFRREGDAEAHRARAIASLLTDRIDPAVREAQSALGVRSGESVDAEIAAASDASLLVDLTAMHYARYERQRSAEDFLVALTAALRAGELAPNSPEVLWNRALLVDALGLVEEARAAWDAYVRVDPRSEWADEARQRRQRLPDRSAATRDPSHDAALSRASKTADERVIGSEAAASAPALKALVERDWIPAWADAVLTNDRSAATRLRAIGIAGAAIRERTGDSLIASFAADAAATHAFAAPHARLRPVQEILQRQGTDAALDVLLDVLTDLRRVRSPLAAPIAVRIAGLQYHAGRHAEALATLDAARAELQASSSPLTEAKAAWARGVALTSLGAVRPAAAAYKRAMTLFGAAGDVSQVGPLHMLLADNAELAGEFDEMWSRYLVAVREGELHSEPERVTLILSTFCRAALRQGRTRVAALLNDALLNRVAAPAMLPYRAQALVTRCELRARLKQMDSARADCDAARAMWMSIRDAAVRGRLQADLELALAAVEPDADDSLNRAVDVSAERHDLYRLARVLLIRGRSNVAKSALRQAEADFERSLVALEEQRQRLEAVADRIAYFETSRAVAEELVRLLVREGRYHDALEIVERVRARALVDRLVAADRAGPLPLAHVLARIPRGEALVVYWCDTSETYVWVLRENEIRFRRESVSRRELADAGRRLVISLSPRSTARTEDVDASGFLYEGLIGPIAGDLAGTHTITFVPDGVIASLPYAALRNQETGRYIVHDFATTRASSATAFALRSPAARYESLLMVMNPTVPNLAPLDVNAEIRAATRVIPRSAVFTRDAATETTLAERAGDYAVIHIAAHGADGQLGEPALALAADAIRDGIWTSADSDSLSLQRGALVVLASCRSGSGAQSAEGVMSLARAFMAAGARSVVAALWDAADADSGLLMPVFYEGLASQRSVAQALRQAQLTALRNPRFSHPRHWAAYQVEGGS
jgi:CHAT domain-containing protein